MSLIINHRQHKGGDVSRRQRTPFLEHLSIRALIGAKSLAAMLMLGLVFGPAAVQSAPLKSGVPVFDEQEAAVPVRMEAAETAPQPAPVRHKTRTPRGASPEAAAKLQEGHALESYARVLDAADEKNYRLLFAALKEGRLQDADTITLDIRDGVLLGTAEAAYILHPRNAQVRYEQVLGWLKNYSDLPQAGDVYKKALSMRVSGAPQPDAPDGSGELTDSKRLIASAQPLEWKKPRAFTADAMLRDGRLDEALAKIGDALPARDGAEETFYPLWVKGLLHWAKADYAKAAESFAYLTETKIPVSNRAAAAFWAARAYEKLNDDAKAKAFMDIATENPRSFYGMLALAGSGDAPATPDSSQQTNAEGGFGRAQAQLLKQNPGALRALAFLQIGEPALAEKELLRLNDTDNLVDALTALAKRYRLAELASRLSGHAARRDSESRVAFFPALPWQPKGGFVSDPALVTAIAWNESRFNQAARNPNSGAAGLMQMMPDTAERIMAGSSASLLDPETSLALGDKYISRLAGMQGINGNLLLLIAGYNCGPGKAQQLFGSLAHGNDPLLFLESIPLKETHDYVQKVLMTYAAYRQRAGKPVTALAALRRGEWPGYEHVRTASR